MIRNKMLIALLSLIFIGNANEHVSNTPKTNESTIITKLDLQNLIQKYVDENGTIGVAVALIDQGEVQFFLYGKKSIQDEEPISENTIFEIGSLTKVFTTSLLMDMANNGEVELDEPIETYLPGVTIPCLVEKSTVLRLWQYLWGNEKKITLRHLATHHSGLPRLPDNFNPKNLSNPYVDYTSEDLYYFLNHYRTPLEEQFEYSNVGMGLLGHILSMHAGLSYEALVQSRICNPLGMTNTAITLSADMKRNFAKGYHLKQEMEPWDLPTLAGAGAIRSNIKDMARFLSANMGLLHSPLTPLLKESHKQQYVIDRSSAIGLGWMISRSKDTDIIWHNGGTGGFRTFLGFNPKTQRGVVVLSNSTADWPDEFSFSILDPNYIKPSIARALAEDLDYLKQFEGSYEATLFKIKKIETKIKLHDSQLISSDSNGQVTLVPESFGIFSLKEMADLRLQFIFDDNGNIIKAQMILPDNTVLLEMMPKA